MAYGIDLLVPDDGSSTAFARCTTDAEYAVGERRWTKDGKQYMYVKFLDAVPYAAGQVVTRANAAGTSVTNDISGGSSLGSIVEGVVVGVPTQNQYGWVQRTGYYATVKTSGADDIAVGENLFVHGSTDGTCDGASASTWSSGNFGVAVAADVDADNTVAADLRLP